MVAKGASTSKGYLPISKGGVSFFIPENFARFLTCNQRRMRRIDFLSLTKALRMVSISP